MYLHTMLMRGGMASSMTPWTDGAPGRRIRELADGGAWFSLLRWSPRCHVERSCG